MSNASRRGSAVITPCVMLATTVVALVSASAAAAQAARVEELVSAVVRINTHINPEGRTVQGLGREREGSGIVIDSDGLVYGTQIGIERNRPDVDGLSRLVNRFISLQEDEQAFLHLNTGLVLEM